MNKYFYFKIIFFLSLIFLISSLFVLKVEASNLSDAFGTSNNQVLGSTAHQMGYDISGDNTPETVIGTVIQVVLGILGVVFVILMIYGGILWMTAGGNEEKISKAQNIIKRSVVGLIIVVSAYIISVFVVRAFIK